MECIYSHILFRYIRALLCLLPILLSSSCSDSLIQINAKSDSAPVVSGRIVTLNGQLTFDTTHDDSNFILNFIAPSAYASTCRFSDITVQLYKLTAGVRGEKPLSEGKLSSANGSFVLRGPHSLAKEIKNSTSIGYILDISGCDIGTNFSRLVTEPENQIVSFPSSLVTQLLEIDGPTRNKVMGIAPVILETFLKKVEVASASSNSILDVYNVIAGNPALLNEFQTLFDTPLAELFNSTPHITALSMPSGVVQEKVFNTFAVTASHWDPGYQIAYAWKVDGNLVSTAKDYVYIPSANSQGNHSVDFFMGRDDGSGGVDLTKPYVTRTSTLQVTDTYPATPPAFVVSGVAATQLTTRLINLEMSTGNARVNCESFSGLALRENDPSAPVGPMEFTIDCTDEVTQLVPYTIASPGDGQKTLYLWAIDSSGNISAVPSVLSVTLIGNPDANTSSVIASPSNNVTSDGGTYSFVTVTIKDALSNPIAGRSVSLTSSRGATDNILILNSTTNSLGKAFFKMSSIVAGATTLSAQDLNSVLNIAQTPTVTFVPTGISGIKSTFTKNIASVASDGVATVTFTATLRDQNNNLIVGKTLAVSSSRPTFDTISPAQVTTDVNGQAVFTARSIKNGISVFTASDTVDGIVLNQTQSVTFLPNAISLTNSVISFSKTVMEPGDTAIATIVLKDANNNVIEDATFADKLNFALYSTGTSQGTFSSVIPLSGQPGTYTSVFTAGTGGTATPVRGYYRGVGVFTSSVMVTVSQRKFQLTGPATTTVGVCSGMISLTHRTSSDVLTPVTTNKSIIFSGTGSGLFFSDSACTNVLSTLEMPAGTSTKNFYYKNYNIESLSIAMSAVGVATATLNMKVIGSVASAFTLTGPSPVTANVCSPHYTLSTVDEFGNGTPVSASTVVNITSGGEGTLYSDPACTNAITSLTIADGLTTGKFYFKGTRTGSFIILVSATDFTSASIPVSITGGGASKLKLTGETAPVTGSCYAYTVTSTDDQNNPAIVPLATTVSLAGKGSGTFYTSSNCTTGGINTLTIVAGTSSKVFYFKDNKVETLTFIATATGLSASTLPVVTSPTAATKLGITGAASILTGVCSAYDVRALDVNTNLTNVAANVIVNLAGNGTGTFYSDSVCTSATTSAIIAAGTNAKTFYFKAASVGSFFFTGTDAGAVLTTSPSLTIATKATQFIMSGPQNISPSACSTYTIINANSGGTPVNVGSATTILLGGKGAGNFYSDPSCTTTISSVVMAIGTSTNTFYFMDATAESLTLTGTQTAFVPAALNVTIGAVKLGMTGAATTPAGTCTPYTVSTQDGAGAPVNALSNVVVTLQGSGAGSFYSDSLCTTAITTTTIASGTSSQTFYFKSLVSELLSFIGSATGFTPAIFNVESTATLASRLQITGPSQVSVNLCSAAFTLYVKDVNYNIVTLGSTLTANLTQSGSATFYSDAACTNTITDLSIGVGSSSAQFYIKSSAEEQLILQASDANSILTQNSFGVSVTKAADLITAGNSHTCAVINGRALCWGRNNEGQLGNNSTADSGVPVQVQGLSSGVTAISSGSEHTCAIKSGALKCWGKNTMGQLGNNSISRSLVPVQVQGLTSGVTAVSAGFEHTCALVNGSMKCWGNNTSYGTIGNDSTTNQYVPAQVKDMNSGVTSIYAGAHFSCGVANGAMKCWGINTLGSLGDNTLITRTSPVQVSGLTSNVLALARGGSTSVGHTCAIVLVAGQNALQCWGSGGNGQLGNSANTTQKIPVQVTGLTSGVTDVSVGTNHTCAIVNGSVQCWGINTTGNLGNASILRVNSPTQVVGLTSGATKVAVGAAHSCAIVKGQITCWGSNQYGQLGSGSNMKNGTPVQLKASGVSEVRTGLGHICARSSDQVQCWGNNSDGQLGTGDTISSASPLDVLTLGAGSLTTAIATGADFSCALVNGTIKCWGNGARGQTGTGRDADFSAPVSVATLGSGVTSFAAGSQHACAIKAGSAFCWGYNLAGQVGDLTLYSKYFPVQVIGLTSGVTQIAPGAEHTCALVNGSVKCWGGNSFGQLGNGTFTQQLNPANVTNLSSGVDQLSSGAAHTCAIVNGGAQCWGLNSSGQLGNDSATTSSIPVQVSGMSSGVTSIAAGLNYTCAVKNGGAWCWGANSSGQLGNTSTSQSVVPLPVEGLSSGVSTIVASTDIGSTCALMTSGALKCWGDNTSGQLGSKDAGVNYTTQPVATMPLPDSGESLPVPGLPSLGSKISLKGPLTLTAGECSTAYTITMLDSAGQNILSNGNSVVHVTSMGAGSVYLDSLCTVPSDSFPVNLGSSLTYFYYKSPFAEDVKFTASLPDFTDGTLSVLVNPAPVSVLSWSGPSSADAGVCSSAISINSRNPNGSPLSVASNVTVNMSGLNGGSFYSDSSCSNGSKLSTVVIAAGTSSKIVYFKNIYPQELSIVGSATTYSSFTQNFTTTTSAPAAIRIYGLTNLPAGGCSNPYFATVEDVNGNLTSLAATKTLQLSIGGSAKVYSDPACTLEINSVSIQAGSTTSSRFYVYDRTIENLLIVAESLPLSAGIFPLQVISNDPSFLAFTGPVSFETATCASFNVHLKDVYGNPTINETLAYPVALSGKGAGTFYSNNLCSTSATSVTIAKGNFSQPVFFKDPLAESLTFVASSTGISTGTFSTASTNAPATKLALTGPSTLINNGCGAYNVVSRDASDNLANVSSNVTVNLGGYGAGAFYSDSGCTSPITTTTIATATNSKTFYFKAPATATFSFTADDAAVTLTSAAPLAVSTKATQLLLTGAQVISPSVCTTYTLVNADAVGTPVNVASAQTIALTGKGNGTFYSDAGCTTVVSSVVMAISTSSKTFYFMDATSEALTFSATNATMVSGSIAVNVGPMKLSLTGPVSSNAGVCSTAYTVTTLNGANAVTNVVGAVTVSLTGEGTGKFFSDSSCSTPVSTITIDAATSSKEFYFQNAVAGAQTLRVSATGFTPASLDISTPLNPASKLKINGPTLVKVNGCSEAFTINVKDSVDNVFPFPANTTVNLSGAGTNGAFYSDSNCTSSITSLSILAGNNGTFYLKNPDENVNLVLTASDQAMTLASSTINVTIRSVPLYVSAGGQHTCAIKNGALFCWGYNDHGETGNSVATNYSTPMLVPLAESGVIGVATSTLHSCVLYNTGGVKCVGHGGPGQIGNGLTNWGNNRLQDVIGLSSGATEVVTGYSYSCALMNDQTMKCWGANYGTYGDGTLTGSLVPVAIPNITGITDLSARGTNTCAVINGGAQCWGSGESGQLGDGNILDSLIPVSVQGLGPGSGVTRIEVGTSFVCAIKNGGLYCWGKNTSGQLGIGTLTNELTPVLVPLYPEGSGVTDISLGEAHACAIANGVLSCWGANTYGQIGSGDVTANKTTPVTIASSATQVDAGNYYTCALIKGALKCWGSNSNGQLGVGTNIFIPEPVDSANYPAGSNVTSISTGLYNSCVEISGSVTCWGHNGNGRLGNGTTTASTIPIQVTGITSGTTSISGYDHNCAVVSGAAQCWGKNSAGQLGNSTINDSTVPVQPIGLSSGVTSIAMANYHTCAAVNGGVQCWGDGAYGKIGDGSKASRMSPTQVSSLPAGSGAITVAVGVTHSCALINDGTVKCWGNNGSGQLGNGTFISSDIPVDVVNLSRPAIALTALNYSNCAILDDSSVQCWGAGISGSLGNGILANSSVAVDVPSLRSGVTAISGKMDSVCAVVDGGVKCWGGGSYILGGKVSRSTVPLSIPGLPAGSGVTAISTGGYHACAVVNGGVKCWGHNSFGQVGDGKPLTNPNITTPAFVLPF